MAKIVCLCNLVSQNEIDSLLKKGAVSVREIQQHTGAGTTCGRCLPELDDLVAKHQKEKPKDQQRKLDLGF
ncbi:MAG: (2Fe-2S)-binding protein [Bacteroidota bacterium]